MPLLGTFLARMYTKRKEFGNPISPTNLAMYLYVPDLAYVPHVDRWLGYLIKNLVHATYVLSGLIDTTLLIL